MTAIYLPAVVGIPVDLSWNTDVTVVGMFVVLFLFIAFGVIYPRPHVTAQEKRIAHLETTGLRNTEALERLADAFEARANADDTVERIVGALQKDRDEAKPTP